MKQETVTIESLLEIIDNQAKEIADLQQKLDYMLRQKFASSSEKFPSNQPSLFQDTSDIAVEEEPQTETLTFTRKKRGNKKIPPESLSHIRAEHDLKEEDKVCKCGCSLKKIKEISSKQYDVIPAEFRVIDNIRFIYVCSCNCGASPITSPLTPQVLPKHQVTPSFLATIAVDKFEDAMPLDRQVKKYKKRFGVDFTTTTFSNWMIKTSELRLKPLIDKLSAIQMNSGYMQTDGYAGYNIVANKEGVTQLGCWAHARRKFADIIKSGVSDIKSKTLAKELVAQVAKLYKIEKEIKDDPPDKKKQIMRLEIDLRV